VLEDVHRLGDDLVVRGDFAGRPARSDDLLVPLLGLDALAASLLEHVPDGILRPLDEGRNPEVHERADLKRNLRRPHAYQSLTRLRGDVPHEATTHELLPLRD